MFFLYLFHYLGDVFVLICFKYDGKKEKIYNQEEVMCAKTEKSITYFINRTNLPLHLNQFYKNLLQTKIQEGPE